MARTLLFDPDAGSDGRSADAGGAASVVARFGMGARAAIDGVAFVVAEPRLRLLAVVPMVVHVALFVALLVAGVVLGARPLGDALEAMVPRDSALLQGDFFISAARMLARALAWVVVLVGAFVGAIVAGSVVCDPFYDLLSERTEEVLLGRTIGAPLSVRTVVTGVVREAGATLVRLLVWGAGAAALTLLSLTPAVVVAGPLSLAWTWLFTAWEYLSRSLTRHTVHIGGRFGAVFTHKALFLGFGAAASLLSLVPLTAPLLVVGGTRAYLALAARGRVASRLTDADRQHLLTLFSR